MISDEGGRGVSYFQIFSDKGGGHLLILADKGGGGVCKPTFSADIISEQPLTGTYLLDITATYLLDITNTYLLDITATLCGQSL